MRAIWTGAIGFGLVNIPIKIYSAVEASELDLDMLDKKDHSNIHFQRVNAKTGKEVAWENIVRGYKLNGQYVVLTDEDFQKVRPEKNKLINIAEFVDETEIDTMYYENPYYLAPDKSGVKAYNLLRDALEETGKVGLGTYVLRNKESIGVIKPHEDALVLNKIRFGEEIRDTAGLGIKATKSKPAELKMAIALINQLTGEFDITHFKDTYSADLLKLIKDKAKGRKIQVPQMRVVHSRSKDLMEQLKASIGKKEKGSSRRKAS
ncbi:Ku protein [Niastella yeongjuensis]|uniref:Non-homologous end joining protein Ku n=1 Tax=Niastella yeongjuensis TaxID=354355 RepID=A0A1V9F2R3_9BACT|nr:Ku protein [Niastella yeongjuensis]OQP52542.1 Ku protein [Niastella yeongjuensis]SEP34622.1 DNA end-binding protein Ku [Niastella yeongjuensis]